MKWLENNIFVLVLGIFYLSLVFLVVSFFGWFGQILCSFILGVFAKPAVLFVKNRLGI